MAPSFDSAVSSLLCAEDNNSIFDNGDEEFASVSHHRNHRTHDQDQSFNLVLPVQSDECLALMVERECQHLPVGDYLNRLRSGVLDLGARMEAVDWIGKVHAHFSFGPLCAYLSINYLDRFLSAYELPGKAWMMQLLAVACLSLAAKMEETEVPLSLDLQVGESKFVFEARTIQRMELLVLSTLKWRMQVVNPFSFLDYFLHKFNGDEKPPRSAIVRSIQLILSTIKGIDFLEFRPSEVAAAVAMSVVEETQTVDIEAASSFLPHVEKERVLRCVRMIHDLSLIGGSVKGSMASISSVPRSPIGVLDAACLSYKSDDTTVVSCANSPHSCPDSKRRKLNRPWEI
ncbi:cyclin-D3-1 isoform X2 [Malania oleifera]|uniref:cyclin-D3-1 isoform X2 n=1 Tax=Malania oleifera TaxID=397392 RepID=UPI0025AECCE7|nr:cyclin-D3-1 isoform X2 [Malania oleifera]